MKIKNTGWTDYWQKLSFICEGKACIQAKWPIRLELICNFCSMKQLYEYFCCSLNGMLVHRRVTPSIYFAGTHLYTWVERANVSVKCLTQEHNTTSPVNQWLNRWLLDSKMSTTIMRPLRVNVKIRYAHKSPERSLLPPRQVSECLSVAHSWVYSSSRYRKNQRVHHDFSMWPCTRCWCTFC